MVTITADDVAEYDTELHNDQSTVPIRLGETLTQRQMLEALLTQSANDIAYALAVWDAGSVAAFVARMNMLAASLGARDTHYVDASGYDAGSVSTAADCVRIAAVAMADPAFAAVVGMTTVSLPLVGTVHNIVSEVGSNGVVGVKSGYTSAAGGCMLLAAERTVGGRSVLVLAAVLGQPVPPPTKPASTTTTVPPAAAPTAPPPAPSAPSGSAPSTTTTTVPDDDLEVPDPFRYTRPAAEGLVSSAEAGLVRMAVARPGQPAGTATVGWGGQTHRAAVVVSRSGWLIGWPGQRAVVTTEVQPVAAGGAGGTPVGTASFRLGSQTEAVPLRLASTVPEPSWWWRLVHD